MAKDRLQRGLRATFLGIAVNIVLGAVKFAAGIFGHSHALIADATESFADIFNSLVVWRGIVVAAAPADEDHPYGYSKAEPLAAAFGAVMLAAAAVWIAGKGILDIYESLHPETFHYHHEPLRWFTLVILVVVIAVKEGLFRFVIGEGEATDNSAVKTDAWHHRSDAITSAGAFIGICIALVGGEKFTWADDAAAIFCALIIAVNGWLLLRPALSELMDKAAGSEVIERIRGVAAGTPGVERVEKCFARKAGHLYFVEMHVQVDPQMTVLRSHEIAHTVKNKIRETMPEVSDVLVHIEPLDIPAEKSQ
ncbi:MAG TPA: cation diffusion facilitator family transporter [Verrucomicrobiae bacterium]